MGATDSSEMPLKTRQQGITCQETVILCYIINTHWKFCV